MATLVGLQDGQACPWVGFGVHYSQETVLHLTSMTWSWAYS